MCIRDRNYILTGRKESIVNIHCCDQNGKIYILNMQNESGIDFEHCVQDYAGRSYDFQPVEGQKYTEFNDITLVIIVNSNVIPNNKCQYSSFRCV